MKWRIGLAALLLALIGAAAWLVYTDFSSARPVVERVLERVLGRTVAVGAFSLRVGRLATVALSGVRVAPARVSAGDDLLRIGRLVVGVDVRSLIDGPVQITEAVADDVTVNLERFDDGHNNWSVVDGRDDTAGSAGRRAVPVLHDLRITNARIEYAAPGRRAPLVLSIPTIVQAGQDDGGDLAGELAAQVGDRTVEVRWQVGPFGHLLTGRDVTFDVDGRVDTLSIRARGVIDDLAAPRRPALDLHVMGPDVDDVTRAFGLPDAGDGPVRLDARLTPGDDGITLSAAGDVAGIGINASGSASDLQALREATFELDAKGPRLGPVMAALGVPGLPDAPFGVSVRLTRSGRELVFEDFALDVEETRVRLGGRVAGLPGLDAADVDFSITGPDLARYSSLLRLPSGLTGPFELAGRVQQATGGVDQIHVRATTQVLRLTAEGPLGDPPTYAGTRLAFTGAGDGLRALVGLFVSDPDMAGVMPDDPFSVSGVAGLEDRGVVLEDVDVRAGAHRLVAGGLIAMRPGLIGSRLTVNGRAGPLETPAGRVEGFAVAGAVVRHAGGVRLEHLKLTGGGVWAQGEVDLDVPPGRVRFRVKGNAADLAALPVPWGAWMPDPGIPLSVSLAGSWADGRLTVEDGRAEIADAVLRWSGTLDGTPANELTVDLDVPELSTLAGLARRPLPAIPLRARARLGGTTDAFDTHDLYIGTGDTTVTGHIAARLDGERPFADATLDVPVLDLAPWMAPVQAVAQAPEQPSDGRLIPELELPFHQLDRADIRLDLHLAELRLPAGTLTEIQLNGELTKGHLIVSSFAARLPQGRLQGSLDASALERPPRVRLDLVGTAIRVGGPDPGAVDPAAVDVVLSLRGRGDTLRDLAATSNGTMVMTSGAGRLRLSLLRLLLSDLVQELAGAFGARADAGARIRCAAVPLAVADGLVRADPRVVVQTEQMNLVSTGTIDLGTERIDVGFDTRPRRRLGVSAGEIVNPNVRLVGTLSAPRLTLNKTNTAVAALTGGWSLLAEAAWDRIFRSDDPCGQALAEATRDQG